VDPINTRGKSVLYLKPIHLEEMRTWVSACDPEEACGLLAGRNRQVFQVIGVENELHSRWRYRMEPHQQLRAFQRFEEQGWELQGIFHSHPAGPPDPSPSDIAEAYYPEAIHLIWSPISGEWHCRAFTIIGARIEPVILDLVSSE